MARSCGIHLGTRRFEIIVLEGGPKKQTLVVAEAGELDPDADNPGKALKEAIARLKVPRDNVGLVLDAGSAAFRRLTLPLTDRAKIEQVLKFEVEKDLPQWDIDDVVADYLVLADNNVSSDLLVTAVPKEGLRADLDLCEKAGADPNEAELETTAMVNAALHSDLCPIDSAQLLVHVGEHTTAVVIVDGGQVNEMRVVHLGALGPRTSESAAAEGSAEDSAGEGAPQDEDELARQQEKELGHTRREALRRIRRELGRSISAARTRNPIESIYVCGLSLHGLVDAEVMDIPVQTLNAFGPEGSSIEQDLPTGERGRWVVAFGAALRELGGAKLSPSLRREELTYAGTWERVEFPLAVCSLLLATLLSVMFILQEKELNVLNNYGSGHWLTWSNAFMMGSPRDGQRGKLSPPPASIRDFHAKLKAEQKGAVPKVFTLDNLAAIKRIDTLLRREVGDLKKELGTDTSYEQPQSALVGAHLVLDLLEGHQKDWRPSIRHIDAITQGMGKSGKSESVRVTLSLVFLADSALAAASHYDDMLIELKKQPWHKSSTRSNVISLENDKGLLIERMPIEVDVSVYYEQQRQRALGAAQ
jgi:Tfp pilus assembly PilM family ATPase